VEADWQLLQAVAGGSAEALGRLYDRHAGTVFALARRIVQAVEDAEEVVQDVFSQVWRDATRYERQRATVAGWIVMLTRARGGGQDAAELPLASSGPSPEDLTLASADVLAVRQALAVLPDAQRELVELAYYEGLTHTELAARTGTPLGTVKTRLRTAMAALRGALVS
jgi:RNA polymerase sigma-70 factor (ECF subfamily)